MRLRTLVWLSLSALLTLGGADAAVAAPVQGQGVASAKDIKRNPSPAAVRQLALKRARKAALEAALQALTGPVDASAKQAVLGSADAWTGRYRILAERTEGDAVHIDVEVEIDDARLAKRLAPGVHASHAPMYRLAAVQAEPACGDAQALVGRELSDLGAVSGGAVANDAAGGDGVAVSIELRCKVLGPVRHTFVEAASVRMRVLAGTRPLADVASYGFGGDPRAAVAHAAQLAAGEAASDLSAHRRGELTIRVESPLPASRIRHFERALQDAVMGVRSAEIGGLEPNGAVVLRIGGDLRADELAPKLEALRLPGFSVTITAIDAADALTVRFQ